uniref:Uncharacterized protein n=1 Tax=Human betaherpesvirus 6 TaxID=10368 RepID=A0A5P9U4E9_9BETA|nr:hypothetical protein [Human betaherpesvirus 6]
MGAETTCVEMYWESMLVSFWIEPIGPNKTPSRGMFSLEV